MDLTLTLHLVAGLGAMGLGTGILLREPSRARNWSFALLCGALALWNLGYVGMSYSDRPSAWRSLFLVGSWDSSGSAVVYSYVVAMALSATIWTLRDRSP